MSKIKFGVWGIGRMGSTHARFYVKEDDKFDLVAACDTNEERLNDAKEEHQCAIYTDADEFLSDSNMELVVIVTLSLDHTKHAVKALESGKYVLLDKPIAISDEELQTLRDADKKYPGKLFILHNLRFEPVFETAQQLLARDLIGEISMVKIRRHHTWGFRADWQTMLEYGGGLLNNWGNHDIDHSVQLLGSHPESVTSQLWHVSAGGNGDDQVKIILKANNRVVDLEICNQASMPEPYCTVHGQRGMIICNDRTGEAKLKYLDPEFQIPECDISVNTKDYSGYSGNDLPWLEETVEIDSSGLWEYIDRKLIKGVYQTIRNGAAPLIKNSDAFETVRIIQEVKKQNPQFDWIK